MISMIAAFDLNLGIGKSGKLPWYIPSDLKRFKQLTIGKNIVMGRKTYQSIGKALTKRNNIIISNDKNFYADDANIINNPNNLLNLFNELFIIGGSQIYSFFLPYADELHLTQIQKKYDADCFFPIVDYKIYKLVTHIVEKQPQKYHYCHWKKI